MAKTMHRSISKAVKAMMQLQVVSACSLLHLRRDHHLAAVRGLSVDLIQRLLHAPVVDEVKLFPADMLKEINDANYQSLQTRAILKATRSKVHRRLRARIRTSVRVLPTITTCHRISRVVTTTATTGTFLWLSLEFRLLPVCPLPCARKIP